MAIFDFRSAHLTFFAALAAGVCTYLSGNPASPHQAVSAAAAAHSNSLFSRFSLLTRFLALPLATPTILSFYCLIQYARTLERRFGSSRFLVLAAFLGGTGTVLAQALLAVFVGSTAANARAASSAGSNNSSLWNSLIVAFATLCALRIPVLGRLSQTASPRLRPLLPYTPLLLASASVLLNAYSAPRVGASSSSSSSSAAAAAANRVYYSQQDVSLLRAVLVSLCMIASGVLPAAAIHFYDPLLQMLNQVGDLTPFSSLVNALLLSGNNVHVRQQGAQREAERQAREIQEAQLQQQAQVYQMGAGGGRGAGGVGTRGGRGGGGGRGAGRGRGGTTAGGAQQQQQQQQQMNQNYQPHDHQSQALLHPEDADPELQAALQASLQMQQRKNQQEQQLQQQQQEQQQQPASAAEQESLSVLTQIVPGVEKKILLEVLRQCKGDANAAASKLIGA